MKVKKVSTDGTNYSLRVEVENGEKSDVCGIRKVLEKLELDGTATIMADDDVYIAMVISSQLPHEKLGELQDRIEAIETERL